MTASDTNRTIEAVWRIESARIIAGLARFVRDAAFTTLNRFVALKMLEARELLLQCVSGGPDSVGYELTSKALVFGGDVLTTTDIVVAAGLEDIGERSRVKHLHRDTIETALTTIHRMADTAVDRMKTSAEPLTVILVGGGAILLSRDLQSASTVLRPEHSSVANAIGAAVAQVGGEVDRVFAVEGTTRDAVLGIAKREASDRAIAAGAQQDSVKIVDVEDVPLAYLPGNATRIRVKAVGDLAMR